MFEVYKEEVELETPSGKFKYKLVPLDGEYLAKLFGIVTNLNLKEGVSDEEMIKNFKPEVIKDMHNIVLETFKRSYPKEFEAEDMEGFVSQNLLKLFQPIIKLNVKEK